MIANAEKAGLLELGEDVNLNSVSSPGTGENFQLEAILSACDGKPNVSNTHGPDKDMMAKAFKQYDSDDEDSHRDYEAKAEPSSLFVDVNTTRKRLALNSPGIVRSPSLKNSHSWPSELFDISSFFQNSTLIRSPATGPDFLSQMVEKANNENKAKRRKTLPPSPLPDTSNAITSKLEKPYQPHQPQPQPPQPRQLPHPAPQQDRPRIDQQTTISHGQKKQEQPSNVGPMAVVSYSSSTGADAPQQQHPQPQQQEQQQHQQHQQQQQQPQQDRSSGEFMTPRSYQMPGIQNIVSAVSAKRQMKTANPPTGMPTFTQGDVKFFGEKCYYKNYLYIGPTVSNRPRYKSKQSWEWPMYPHGVSKLHGKLRIQIKQRGFNPSYPMFPNTLEGLLGAALFRDKEIIRLWNAEVLVRSPKFNFDHGQDWIFSRPSRRRRRNIHGNLVAGSYDMPYHRRHTQYIQAIDPNQNMTNGTPIPRNPNQNFPSHKTFAAVNQPPKLVEQNYNVGPSVGPQIPSFQNSDISAPPKGMATSRSTPNMAPMQTGSASNKTASSPNTAKPMCGCKGGHWQCPREGKSMRRCIVCRL